MLGAFGAPDTIGLLSPYVDDPTLGRADIEAILEHRVSDTTLRARRDEWIAAGSSRR